MELVYALVGAGVVVVVAVLLFVLRRKPLKVVSRKLSFDLLPGSQKNKKRKHFGFSKNKKKSDGEGENVKAESVPKGSHEKKGKKKGKSKGKANVGGKNILEAEAQPEVESDNGSTEIDEDKEMDETPVMEQLDDFTQMDGGKSSGGKQSLSPKANTESKKDTVIVANAPGKGSIVDTQKESAGEKKGKKNKPRKEDDSVVVKKESLELSVMKEKEAEVEKVRMEDENGVSNNEEKDVAIADASGEKAAKKRKKKKKNGKANGEWRSLFTSDFDFQKTLSLKFQTKVEQSNHLLFTSLLCYVIFCK